MMNSGSIPAGPRSCPRAARVADHELVQVDGGDCRPTCSSHRPWWPPSVFGGAALSADRAGINPIASPQRRIARSGQGMPIPAAYMNSFAAHAGTL